MSHQYNDFPSSPRLNPSYTGALGVCDFANKARILRSLSVNPLSPNISLHILHSFLYTFPMVLTWRNLFNNQELLWSVIVSFNLITLMCDSEVIL